MPSAVGSLIWRIVRDQQTGRLGQSRRTSQAIQRNEFQHHRNMQQQKTKKSSKVLSRNEAGEQILSKWFYSEIF